MISKKLNESRPFFTIITIVYNNEDFIEDCIKSVLSQTYNDYEYIIIDGGSTDNTLPIINKYKKNISRIISEKDSGIYEAFNKGLNYANGKYIGFLNSDDFYKDKSVLESISKEIISKKTDIIFSNIKIIDRNSNRTLRVQNSKNFRPFLLRFGIAPPHPTFYCSQKVYKEVGKYSTRYKVSADFEMMVRILYKNRYSFCHLNRIIVIMRSGGISNNSFIGKINQNIEIVRAAKENSLYTNVILILFKIPFKIVEILRRNFV